MNHRSMLTRLALFGGALLLPFISLAQGAVEEYVVNYRANSSSPWILYTTTRALAEAQGAVAELQLLGYQAEYLAEPVAGPVYYSDNYIYSPGTWYYHTGGYDHYHFNDHHVNRYHYNHWHYHRFVHHHASGDHHYIYHHSHIDHHHVIHHHEVHHHSAHHHR
jgi:hypothetical protein